MKAYKTHPILKERIWGGQKLKDYNKEIGDACIGESWETTGQDKHIPMLIKLIDANDKLSVQVHPDDAYGRLIENQKNGKNEIWIILDCKEDSHIIYGFKGLVDKHRVKKAIEENKLIEILNLVKVKKGDCIYIPAGTVHTLGEDILAYEAQQPSDLTYRLFDWNRLDAVGQKRELHIDKALDVINYNMTEAKITNIYDTNTNNHQVKTIFQNELFKIKHFKFDSQVKCKFENNEASAITIINGAAYIINEGQSTLMQKGDTWIIPPVTQSSTNIQALHNIEFIEAACNISKVLP